MSDSQTNATRGWNSSASSVTPTRCVDVPPGTGIMIVWIANDSAVSDPMTGNASVAAWPKCFFAAHAHRGAETA